MLLFQNEVSPTLADRSNLTVESRLMKKTRQIVSALALALLCATAHAEWTEIQTFEDGMRVFVDNGTPHRNGDIAVLSHLVRWAEPQEDEGIHPYRSTIVRNSYDCAGKHEKYLGSTSYAESMGNGAKVTADDNEAESWYSISEGSMEEKLWKIACQAK